LLSLAAVSLTDDLLHSVYEYRKLLSQEQLLGLRMSAEARARLDELERLLAAHNGPPGAPRRRHARTELRMNATVKASGRVHPVKIVNFGGGGICVEPAPNLRGGERAVVRLVSTETGREYQYPVQARWVHRSGQASAMGMPFVGAPLLIHDVRA